MPGLLRPIRDWMKDYDWQPKAEALATLLDRAAYKEHLEHPYVAAAHLLGWRGKQFPAAYFRARGQDVMPPRDGDWVCADPIHLRADASNAVVMDSRFFDLRKDEAEELMLALEPQFVGCDWNLCLGSSDKWYLQTPSGEAPDGIWLDEVTGRKLSQIPLKISDQLTWQRLLTEIQMIWHQHPVNLARQARGVPVINSLWCWGKGTNMALESTRIGRVLTRDSLVTGLAHAAQIPCVKPLPENLDSMRGLHQLVFLDELLNPAVLDKLHAWEETLERLDREWFSVLDEWLRKGAITRIHLYTETRQWIIRPRRLMHRWKRAHPITKSLGL